MWLTPVPCELPMVGCTAKISSTPSHVAVSGRPATGWQSKCLPYQRTASEGLAAVICT